MSNATQTQKAQETQRHLERMRSVVAEAERWQESRLAIAEKGANSDLAESHDRLCRSPAEAEECLRLLGEISECTISDLEHGVLLDGQTREAIAFWEKRHQEGEPLEGLLVMLLRLFVRPRKTLSQLDG